MERGGCPRAGKLRRYMGLIILRVVFVLVAAGLSVRMIQSQSLPNHPTWLPWAVFGSVLALAIGVIVGDTFIRRKRIDTVSAVYFGLIVGLFLTYVLRLALAPVLPHSEEQSQWVQLVLGMVLVLHMHQHANANQRRLSLYHSLR